MKIASILITNFDNWGSGNIMMQLFRDFCHTELNTFNKCGLSKKGCVKIKIQSKRMNDESSSQLDSEVSDPEVQQNAVPSADNEMKFIQEGNIPDTNLFNKYAQYQQHSFYSCITPKKKEDHYKSLNDKRSSSESASDKSEMKKNNPIQTTVKKKKNCECKKNKCNTNYCQCYQAGQACSLITCGCVDCGNRKDDQIRSKPIKSLSKRLPCACRNNYCQKKHCTCFKFGNKCGESCKCSGCHNSQTRFASRSPQPKKRPKTNECISQKN